MGMGMGWVVIVVVHGDFLTHGSYQLPLLYPTKLLGGILISLRPSVRPASHVRSVGPTVLVGFISYWYILLSNFRWCVVCKVFGKITKLDFLAIISDRRRSSCSSLTHLQNISLIDMISYSCLILLHNGPTRRTSKPNYDPVHIVEK